MLDFSDDEGIVRHHQYNMQRVYANPPIQYQAIATNQMVTGKMQELVP